MTQQQQNESLLSSLKITIPATITTKTWELQVGTGQFNG